MFPRRERISRAAFPGALASGGRRSTAHFLGIFPKEGKGYAVVIPKKVARLSTTRHRLKRQVLEALRTLPLPSSLIILPRAAAAQMRYDDIRAELAELLSPRHPR